MNRIVLKIDGMVCGMCEAHVNNAIRNALNEDHVTSSAKKGETVITTEKTYTPEEFHTVLDPTGYKLLDITVEKEASGKKGFFGKLFSK